MSARQPRLRREIPTPALLCDVDALRSNIVAMSDLAKAAGLRLRPHTKSHKSAYVADLQLAHGAVGLSCAKLSEAEVLVDRLSTGDGIERLDVLITSPIAGVSTALRAAELAGRCDLSIVVDHCEGVEELARATDEVQSCLTVLCDVDVGLKRSGVTNFADALSVVESISRRDRLTFGGVQGYAGHVQHHANEAERRYATLESSSKLAQIIKAIESSGHEVRLRTGGGTGTCIIDAELGVLNELQAGSYVFMDRQYLEVLGTAPSCRFQQSLFVASTVVSSNHSEFVTVDAGLKSMATDAGNPTVVGLDHVKFRFFGDEHGLVTTEGVGLTRGDRLELVPPHCDPTVDRYDQLWLVRGSDVVRSIAIDARGCSQ